MDVARALGAYWCSGGGGAGPGGGGAVGARATGAAPTPPHTPLELLIAAVVGLLLLRHREGATGSASAREFRAWDTPRRFAGRGEPLRAGGRPQPSEACFCWDVFTGGAGGPSATGVHEPAVADAPGRPLPAAQLLPPAAILQRAAATAAAAAASAGAVRGLGAVRCWRATAQLRAGAAARVRSAHGAGRSAHVRPAYGAGSAAHAHILPSAAHQRTILPATASAAAAALRLWRAADVPSVSVPAAVAWWC